jgi:hypothetical protein
MVTTLQTETKSGERRKRIVENDENGAKVP